MRIIAVKTLKKYWLAYPDAEQQLRAWYDVIEKLAWKNPNELKLQFRNASVINDKRVVFNIHGNAYRLVADIEYRLGIVYIVWFGTHKEYDKANIKTLKYEN